VAEEIWLVQDGAVGNDLGECRQRKEATMTSAFEHPRDVLVRIPMSWEEYLDRELPRGDYYGGAFVVAPGPSIQHQHVAMRLSDALRTTCPTELDITFAGGWGPPGVREELYPDLIVHGPVTSRVVTARPELVVEVLSSNRSDDLVGKMNRYAAWGAPSYWIVDPRDRVLLEYRLSEGVFVEIGLHTDGVVTLTYGGGVEVSVDVDLDVLFG
jgi:Uma2 family endonuclease